MISKTIGAAIALGTVLATTGTAQAADANSLRICSYGDYVTYVTYPERGNLATQGAQPRTCLFFGMGTSGAAEQIKVFGVYKGRNFYITQGKVRPSKGANVDAHGTYAGSHWAEIS